MRVTERFRQLINAPEILVMPGAHDALSARIVEQAGFKAIGLGGAGYAICALGKPDVGLVTMTEMANHIDRIADAVQIPVFADGDTGYGNVTNVARTTRAFEKAGAAGFFLEDQVAPKRCGHRDGKQIVSRGEMVAKVHAAVDARKDQSFVVMARTDALAVEGIEAAIERVNLYHQAGADLVLVDALTDIGEMAALTSNTEAKTMATQIEGGRTPIMPVERLAELGFAVVTYPGTSFFAAAFGIRQAMRAIMESGGTQGVAAEMIGFEGIDEIVGLSGVRSEETHYAAIMDE